MIPDSLLSVMYDSNDRKIGFFYNEDKFMIEKDLVINNPYKIKIQQELKRNGEYVLSVEKNGTKIYNNVNDIPYFLPSARVYFSNNQESSLESAATIENVSIIKGN